VSAYDVAVVGAGVVGCAIARELSAHDVSCALVEAGPDVGAGTSKANTAILHTGFDAKPGSLEAGLVRRGYELLGAYAERVGIPVERTGALLVAWSEDELGRLPAIVDAARANGYDAIREVGVEELREREPMLGPGALGGLEVPGESIVCPWTTPFAYATEAVMQGCELLLDTPVTGIRRGFVLETPGRELRARFLVNAAGLRSDVLDRMLGHEDFEIRPRRGQLIVFDKLARSLVRHVLLPVPTATTKGVLVAPTVFGNVMLGPTAEEIPDPDDTESTREGLDYLLDQGRRIVPGLLDHEVTAVYAGVRAATEHSDYQLHAHQGERYVCVGGIRSTGLTASMAIAEHVRDALAADGLDLGRRRSAPELRMPNIGEAEPRPYERGGEVVCFCERVTRDEVNAALSGVVPARDLDGLRRRTRVLMGRCQGFFCGAHVARLVADATGVTVEDVLGRPRA
jgi:glycerol-3-phosphate dehydrogenase